MRRAAEALGLVLGLLLGYALILGFALRRRAERLTTEHLVYGAAGSILAALFFLTHRSRQ